MAKLKLGVVGLGKMGQLHLNKALLENEIEISGIYDLDLDQCQKVAAQFRVKTFEDLDQLFFESDAIVVAASTKAHFEIAVKAIGHGLALFIEKPICDSVEKAEQLISLAKEKNVLIQVGFVERYCWKKLVDLKPGLFSSRPKLISTERCASKPSREKGLDIVSDLMIHDIDFVLWAMGEPPISISAEGVSVGYSPVDVAFARIDFASGSVAYLRAAWIFTETKRATQVSLTDSYLSFDLQNRKAQILTAHQSVEDIGLTELDPLSEQLKMFVHAVQGNGVCLVSGVDGLKSLEVTELIKQQILNRDSQRTILSDRERRFLLKSWGGNAS